MIRRIFNKNIFFLSGLLLLFLILFIILARHYYGHLLYLDFMDEDDNFLLGQMILQGKRLYGDVFSHHQPLAYIMSAIIQKLTNPSSIFLVVKRHREFMIMWSLMWAVIMIFRFRFRGFMFSIFYEYSKMLNFGHMFISEAIIFYPLAYLTMELFEKINSPIWNIFWLAGIVWFIAFQYLMLWPILFLYSIYFLWRIRFNNKLVISYLGFLFLLTLPLLKFISLPEYIYNSFYINGAYYSKLMANSLTAISFFTSMMLPLSNFIEDSISAMGIIFRMLFGMIIITFILMYERKKKIFPLLLAVLVILTLASLRYIPIGLQEYFGFHTLPYYAIVLAFVIQIVTRYLAKQERNSYRIVTVILIILALVIYKRNFLFHKHNLDGDYYYHFSSIVNLGEAIRIMKDDNDRLFVSEINQLVYWHSKIQPFSKYTYYYRWMNKTPPIRKEVENQFSKELPEFLIFTLRNDKENFFLKKYLKDYFLVLKDNYPVDIYVHKDKAQEITKTQRKDLDFFLFTFDLDHQWCGECAGGEDI